MASRAQIKSEPPLQTIDLPPEQIYFGPSKAMEAVRWKVTRAAGLNVPILILGESGTGKEVLARYVHARSPWNGGPFVKVNCAAIPGTLIESELFGFEKGAFTGAHAAKPGRMESAQGGTLFLDEIAEIDASLQAKLLHVLQDATFTRIGGHTEKHLDARIVCATNRKLQNEIESGAFRSDLLYRINVITVQLPPLRGRRDDIPYLAEYLRQQFNRRFRRSAPPLTLEAMKLLQEQEWPGNVRELENWLARYVVLGTDEVFSNNGAQPKRQQAVPTTDDGHIPLKHLARQATRDMERDLIVKVLEAHQWNRRRAAEALNISYRTLLYKARQAGILVKVPPAESGSGPALVEKSRVRGD